MQLSHNSFSDEMKLGDAEMPKIISFEGLNGCGKSSLIKCVLAELNLRGQSAKAAGEIQHSAMPATLRRLNLYENDFPEDALLESLLVACERRCGFLGVGVSSTELGTVVFERHVDTFMAFGRARKIDTKLLISLKEQVFRPMWPRKTILIDLPARQARLRLAGSQQHRVEQEPIAFHERVREEYLRIAETEKERILVLDGTLSIEENLQTSIDFIS